MLRKLINWFRGYLTIRIQGTSPERFINLCCNKKIFIWNLRRIDQNYEFNISIKNFKKLKPIVRKTHLVPRIVKKHGFPFYSHRYRKRKGFLIGVILCAVLLYIMSLYIWDINVYGGSKYTPEAILKFLNQKQIYTGIKKKKVNCQEIEERIRLEYKDIGWVSAEIKGTRLNIKITETSMPAPAIIARAPSHIVATKDAIIRRMVTSSGTPMVKVGDVVKKGDILVSGILTIKSDFDEILDLKPVIADAEILCKSYYDYKDVFSMDYIKKIYTGDQITRYYMTLGRKKIFLYKPSIRYDKYDIIDNENTFHITDSYYLPFRYGTVTIREYIEQKRSYSQEEAISIAKEKLKRYFDQLNENGVLILENNVTITIENNSCITQGRIIVEEPAWEYKTIQESEWRIEQTDEHNGDNN